MSSYASPALRGGYETLDRHVRDAGLAWPYAGGYSLRNATLLLERICNILISLTGSERRL